MKDLTYYDTLIALRRDNARHWRAAFNNGDMATVTECIEADCRVAAALSECAEWQAVREACRIMAEVGV